MTIESTEQPDAAVNHEFEALLDHLKRSRGFDFTGYKRSTLMRRVNKRMQMIEVDEYGSYIDYLEVHPDEFAALFNTILINVTAFYRDPMAWEYIEQEVVPRLISGKGRYEPIRLWSAGCASGEEAYTLAMVLASALGMEQFRERVKIYATDADENALNQARLATYDLREVAGVPPDMLEKYFEKNNSRFVVNKDLRRAVIFGRHDLVQDAPISRIDLLVCRNALMYFNAEVQNNILSRLHFALNDGAFLFLGKAEMLFTHTDLFTPLDLKRRIFTKVPKGNGRDRTFFISRPGFDHQGVPVSDQSRLRALVFDAAPTAQIIVDASGCLALANERVRALFRLNADDIQRPLQDLEMSYRPVDLRSAIDQANSERRTITLSDIPWPPNILDPRVIEIQIAPLIDDVDALLGTSISFIDVTRYKHLQEELQDANRELETAYEELQSTNEELETTNEELQSTNEELETTNEELQSTNEELETMNEELQSTNEELQTTNDELHQRGDDLKQVNAFVNSVLAGLRTGVVVMDKEMLIQVWNRRCEDLWGLRAEEARGKHFMNLDIGLPVEKVRGLIRACLAGEEHEAELTLSSNNRRGKQIECRVIATPLRGADHDVLGVILLMEECGQE